MTLFSHCLRLHFFTRGLNSKLAPELAFDDPAISSVLESAIEHDIGQARNISLPAH